MVHLAEADEQIALNSRAAALASLTSAHVAALELIEAIAKAREELK